MRKLKLLSFVAMTAFAMTACSSSKTEVEQASEQELFTTGQAYLEEGDYSQATRYLEAVDTRFPGGAYGEQAELNLIYAAYKTQDYTKALVMADRFLKQYPNSQHVDYVLYMAALTNSALGDNAIQDFFGVDRATRENTTMKTAFSNFQTLVQNFPNSPYTPDALARMAYIKDRLARHELEIAKFYYKRNAYVAAANRVVGMLQSYPDTYSTLQALPIMKESYEKMGLTKLAQDAETLIKANEGREIKESQKPDEPFLKLPNWLKFGSDNSEKTEG